VEVHSEDGKRKIFYFEERLRLYLVALFHFMLSLFWCFVYIGQKVINLFLGCVKTDFLRWKHKCSIFILIGLMCGRLWSNRYVAYVVYNNRSISGAWL
jgi:hypothetical protein